MKKFLYLLLAVLCPLSALSQNLGTGAYPFSSFDTRGFDAVNLGNLNVRFAIPVISRQGRGLPFVYALQYEGLIWAPAGTTPNTAWVNDPAWGLSGTLNGTSFTGYMTDTQTSGDDCPEVNGRQEPNRVLFTNFVYHDPYGASHKFNYSRELPCIGSNTGITVTGNGSSNDGSGYTFNGAAVITRNGRTIVPGNSATGQDATSITDTNGNEISNNAGTFTDTIGATALTIAGSGPVTFTYPVALQSNNAMTASASLTYATYTVRTNFQCSGITEYGSNSVSLPDRVTLADGSYYHFTYEGTPAAQDGAVTGRLASLTLPTGGVISYSYSGGCNNSGINADGSTAGLTRTTTDGTRTYVRASINANAYSTTVTDEKSNQSVYKFTIAGSTNHYFYETHRQVYEGSVGGSPLQDKSTCYNNATAPCDGASVTLPLTEADTLESFNVGSQASTKNAFDAYGDNTSTAVYAVAGSTSTLMAKVATTYNSLAEVASSVVTDSSGNTVSSTTFGYDETTPTATASIPQHVSVSGTRGNQTSSKVLYSGTSTLNTTTVYYDTGMAVSTTAASGTTSYGYDSTQTFTTQTTLPNTPSGVALSTTASYDAASTVALSSTGMNANQTTKITAYDALLRPTQGNVPNAGAFGLAYTPTQVTQSWTVNSQADSIVYLSDSYGRPSRTALRNGQTTNPFYQTDNCYDASGLLSFVPTPYQSTGFNVASRCSGSGTSTAYDALGRVTGTTTDDGPATTTYMNRAVKMADVNGVARITQYDVLGRITAVCEISSNTLNGIAPTACGMDISGNGFVTSYAYNLVNHTTTVTQGQQTRTFITDAAGRTISVTEPERGNTTYSYAYNATGLQVVRTRPRANYTSGTTQTTTQYDSLGRVASVTYSDGLTPTKNYYYDVLPSGQGWTSTPTNVKGQLVATTSGSGTTLARSEFSYDIMGNVTSLWQCAPSICGGSSQSSRPLTFTYDYANNLTSETDPTSGAISYGRSIAGEITSVTNGTYTTGGNPPNLVTNVVNTPFGPTSYSLGNGVQSVRSYDTLGRNSGKWACIGSSAPGCSGTGTITQIYGNSLTTKGLRITGTCDTLLDECATNTYDEFNRLTAVTDTTHYSPDIGSFTYTYDRYGNRLTETSSGSSPSTPVTAANNRVTTVTYDAAGNALNDTLGNNFTYDAEGKILTVSGGATGQYVYDALNHRVRAQTSSQTVEYLFDMAGRRTSTWNSSNVGIEGRIYMDGTQLAFRAQAGTTFFEHQNWLGTDRIRTDYQGNLAASELSGPFGESFSQGVAESGSDQDNNQFTSVEYDAESMSHHAQFRQYSLNQGRWMSPDPYDGSYNLYNPQSLNRYSYALNNPLRLIDPSGLCGDDGGNGSGDDGGDDPDVCAAPPQNPCPPDTCVTVTAPPDPPAPISDPCDPITLCYSNPPMGGNPTPPSGGGAPNGGRRCIANCGNTGPTDPTGYHGEPSPCMVSNLQAVNATFGLGLTLLDNVLNGTIYNGGLNVLFTVTRGSMSSVPVGRYPLSVFTRISGVGRALHVPGPNSVEGVYEYDEGAFLFNTHIDTAYATWHTPLGAAIHGGVDVLDNGAFRSPCGG